MTELPFGKLFNKIIDNRGKTCPTATNGTPLIATNCIKNDQLYPIFEKVRFVDDETMKYWFRGHPKPGNILFVTKGTPGRVAWVPNPVNFCIAQDMLALDVNEKLIYPKYLFAVLRSNIVQGEIENLHVGSLIPHFKKGDFDRLSIPIPERPMQEYIGDSYFEFCLKIDLLHRQNKTLEEMAETLFRKWLNKFNDREQTTLGEYIKIQNGYAFKSSDFKDSGNNSILKITNISFEQVDIHNTQFVDDKVVDGLPEKFLAVPKSFLIAMTGAEIGKIGIVGNTKKKLYINQRVGKIVDSFEHSSLLGYLFLRSPEGQDHVINTCTGSAQENISSTGIESMLVPKCTPEEVVNFCKTVDPFFEKIIINLNQIQHLMSLRDTLLPKLMSGQIICSN